VILIFGSNGYMGSAVMAECDRRGIEAAPGRRDGIMEVMQQIKESRASIVINCAAFIPQPTVDECKNHIDSTIAGNVWWPSVLRSACEVTGIPIMHVSTGCLFDEQREYTEEETPTRGWDGYCGFYVGTKLLAEKLVRGYEKHYILRLRLPFDEVDHPRNYLSKLAKFDRVFDHENSLTHRGDFAKWALDLWEKRSPFGTYHCVNTGQIAAWETMEALNDAGLIIKAPELVRSPGTTGARLSNDKLRAAIGSARNVHDAVQEAVTNWKSKT
jgi:dTDP-4-dehydrorhamnose reductase